MLSSPASATPANGRSYWSSVWRRGWRPVSWRHAVQLAIVTLCFVTARPTVESLAIGAMLSLSGELFRIWAAGYGYKLGAAGGRGPYRFVRHPYYLGSTLLFLGLVYAGRDPYVMVIALISLAVVYRRDMRGDETQMALSLGPEYSVYRDQVPAFLPQLVPYSGLKPRPGPKKFSLRYAMLTGHHRELDAALLLLAGYGLLALCSQLGEPRLFHLASAGIVGLYLLLRFLYYAFYKKNGRRS